MATITPMPQKYEYATTTAPASPISTGFVPAVEPFGDGWEFVGTSANGLMRFFEWRRPIKDLTTAKK